MEEKLNKPEPKRIKMPSLLDRCTYYGTMRWDEQESSINENNQQNHSQSLSELESDSTD